MADAVPEIATLHRRPSFRSRGRLQASTIRGYFAVQCTRSAIPPSAKWPLPVRVTIWPGTFITSTGSVKDATPAYLSGDRFKNFAADRTAPMCSTENSAGVLTIFHILQINPTHGPTAAARFNVESERRSLGFPSPTALLRRIFVVHTAIAFVACRQSHFSRYSPRGYSDIPTKTLFVLKPITLQAPLAHSPLITTSPRSFSGGRSP